MNTLRRSMRDLATAASVSAIVAGFLSALLNFAGPFLIVLEATRSAGISEQQTASWVWALSLGNGVCGLLLSMVTRIPVIVAWSTPGAALLIAALGGFSFAEAVGAFLVASLVSAVIGMSGWFGVLLAKVPAPILQALLAGILLPFVVSIAPAFLAEPLIAGSTVLAFLLGKRFFDRYAVLLAVLVGIGTTWATGALMPVVGGLSLAGPVFTMPVVTVPALVSIALPLCIVTLASQNAPGLALLQSQGYRPNDRLLIGGISMVSAVLAPFGAHGINLGAITAAIAVGPESHPDPSRRYVAGIAGGVTYLAIGSAGGALVTAFQAIPIEAVQAIAGVALMSSALGALAGAVSGGPATNLAALTTLTVTLSGCTVAGIGAPFWALLAGVFVLIIVSPAKRQ